MIRKGFEPTEPASGYDRQLNNVVIVVNQSEKPEETVKELNFLEKMKQYLSRDSQ
jgi:hypothetical protein